MKKNDHAKSFAFRRAGFTLFEMLVVISIIAIMTAAISLSFSSAQRKARDAKRTQDMKSIQSSAEQYYSLNSYKYPPNTSTPWTINGQTILAVFPSDPKGAPYEAYRCTSMDATGAAYCCCAKLENTGQGNSSTNICGFGVGDYYCVKNQQ